MAQFTTSVPFDNISFYGKGMTFGKGIANFFVKNNITHVIFILNFHNNSLTIQKSGEKGYPIIKEQSHYRLYNSILKNYIWRNCYKARKLNQESIIIENLTLKTKVFSSDSKFITVRPSLIAFGDLGGAGQLLSNDKFVLSLISSTPQVSRLDNPNQKIIYSKESPKNDVSELSAMELPPSEAQDRADKAYSRMILGE